MVIEILLTLLIILVILLFLLFIKPWHLHIIFKNNNLVYNFQANIKILILEILIKNSDNGIILRFKLNLFSKSFTLFDFNPIKNNLETDNQTETSEDAEEDFNLSKIKNFYNLMIKSKEDLMDVIKVVTKTIEFDESYSIINLGVSDNNLTIKICNLIWALTAPLYTLNFIVNLTPEINSLILKTDSNIKFNIYFFNILKLIFIFLTRKSLRDLIEFFIK